MSHRRTKSWILHFKFSPLITIQKSDQGYLSQFSRKRSKLIALKNGLTVCEGQQAHNFWIMNSWRSVLVQFCCKWGCKRYRNWPIFENYSFRGVRSVRQESAVFIIGLIGKFLLCFVHRVLERFAKAKGPGSHQQPNVNCIRCKDPRATDCEKDEAFYVVKNGQGHFLGEIRFSFFLDNSDG